MKKRPGSVKTLTTSVHAPRRVGFNCTLNWQPSCKKKEINQRWFGPRANWQTGAEEYSGEKCVSRETEFWMKERARERGSERRGKVAVGGGGDRGRAKMQSR